MPPRAKAANRAGADESEDDLAANAIRSKAVNENTRTTTKMPKAKTTAKRKAAAPRQPRQALKDRTNVQDAHDAEEVDAFEEEDDMAEATKPKAKRAKATITSRKAANDDDKATDTKAAAPSKRGRAVKRAPSPGPLMTIPETQPDPDMMEDVEQSIEDDANDLDLARWREPKQAQRFVQRAPSVPVQTMQPLQPRPSARSGSAQPGLSRVRERSGSAGVAERRGGDPELRRQLNEMTTKYENLSLKYESLQEVGKSQADSNFEKLKRASDQKAKDASELIASLKKELVELRKSSSSATSETSGLHKQISTLTTSNEKLTTERDSLKEKLQVSQNEVKSLETKLMAARQQISTSVQEAKAQETATKKLNGAVSAHGSDAQKEAKMKENLYADLTGLIVLGVKRKEGEDEYDCIQTGRNGSLHFHLAIMNDATTPHPKTPSGLNYEDAEFAYEPLLDESRDRELLDLLPDYLTEEICFPRNHAQRFYSKVVDSMTKKIVVEEE